METAPVQLFSWGGLAVLLGLAGPLSLSAQPVESAAPSAGEKSVYEKSEAKEGETPVPKDLFKDGKKRLLIRVDDIGFCHAANMAFKQIAEEGEVTAASVIVNTPWLDEAVDLLKAHPEVSVGVHTCLNSEWVPYRWGPVLPARDVPSLVDEWGKFFGTRALMVGNNPSADEAEKEIRAQIDLAMAKGLKLSYIDHHMGAAVTTPELKERFIKIAKDYNLPISRWCGEAQAPVIYSTPPEEKVGVLVDGLEKIEQAGTYLLVVHPGQDVPEMQALHDLNATGLPDMPRHRAAEAKMLCSPELKKVIQEKEFELVGYDTYKKEFPGLWIDPEKE